MKPLYFVLFLLLFTSCSKTAFVVLGYERPDFYSYDETAPVDTSVYVYLLQRVNTPKFTKRLYVKEPCGCMRINDTIFFTRENDSLVVNKYVNKIK